MDTWKFANHKETLEPDTQLMTTSGLQNNETSLSQEPELSGNSA